MENKAENAHELKEDFLVKELLNAKTRLLW